MDERSKEKFWENRNWNVNVENLFPLGAVILFQSVPRPLFHCSPKENKERKRRRRRYRENKPRRKNVKGVGSMPSDAVMAESSTYVERGRAK